MLSEAVVKYWLTLGKEQKQPNVVARRDDVVVYYEDVEEGFNLSPLGPDGRILQHWCNQDDLKHALWKWMND